MKFNVINVLGVSIVVELVIFLISAFCKIDPVTFVFGFACIVSMSTSLVLGLMGHSCGKYISKCCCDIGWHVPTAIKYLDNDPLCFQQEAECKHCGMKGLIDSQGNLF